MNHSKEKILLLLQVCLSMHAFGQWNMPQDYPSPNAANLGLYGQIPVSHFTGTPDISIPIHTIQMHEFQLPIELRYHIGSVKPDNQPGWTGLGWTLTAGGSITRIIKGLRDETTINDFRRETGNGLTNHLGYYYNSSTLNNASNWTNSAFLLTYSASSNNAFNINVDFEPDEFLFNFAGFSGSFFYNGKSGDKDQFKVKSQQLMDLDISTEVVNTDHNDYFEAFKSNTSFADYERKLRLQTYFSRFTVIDQNGNVYEFGGNKNAIDFTTTRAGSNTITTAVTWYLTSITTPNGDCIQFTYKKAGDLFVNTRLREKLSVNSNNSNCAGLIYETSSSFDGHLSILHLSYLDRITASSGETIDFTSSVSDELGYDYSNVSNFAMGNLASYQIEEAVKKKKGNYKHKLDLVSISNTNTGDVLKKFYFDYDNVSTQRLHLDAFRSDQYKYEFIYNTTALPAYNAKQSDHWGFYNGKSYENTTYGNLFQTRTPDVSKMKAETLEEIIYPTGGSAKFEYEAHTYSKMSTVYAAGGIVLINLSSESGTAGGLRIRKITSRSDKASSTGEVVKEYFYILSNNTSSGILSGKPVYETIMQQTGSDINAKALYQSENFINPLGNTNGAHVTYSRVEEKMSDGASSVYYYINHENQPDESAVFGIKNITYQSVFIAPFSSKEVGRGFMNAEVHKNSQGITIDSTYYEYRYPYESFVKSVSRKRYGLKCSFIEIMACHKQYTCIPNLSKKIEIRYDKSGNNPITTTTNYSYNAKNLLSETNFVRNDGKIYKTKYTYPFEIQGWNEEKMVAKNILSNYIEKVTSLNGSVIDGEYRRYEEIGTNSGIFRPAQISLLKTDHPISMNDAYPMSNISYSMGFSPGQTQVRQNFSVEKVEDTILVMIGVYAKDRTFYPDAYTFKICSMDGTAQFTRIVNKYDGLPNVRAWQIASDGLCTYHEYNLQVTLRGGAYYAEATQWTPNKIEGSTDIIVPHRFETLTASPYLEPEVSYKYDNKGNIKESKPAGSNVPTTYLWGYTHQYPIAKIENATYESVRAALGYTADNQIETLAGKTTPSSSDWTTINKLRTQLPNAMVTTYTYKPLVGLKTVTDSEGKTITYEYDSFNRLQSIKDHNGKEVENYDYHYKN